MKKMISAAIMLLPLIGAGVAKAEDFPTKAVTIVIPSTPGSSIDTLGRYVAESFSKQWGKPVVVENRAGAGSQIGMAYLAKAKPDGYTLVFTSNTFTTNAAVQKSLPYDPVKDLQPVGMVARGDMAIVTGPRVSASNLEDLIKKARFGKVFFGSSGNGSASRFASELLNEAAQVKMEAVNYKGAPEALIDIAGGRLDVYVGALATITPSLSNENMKLIAIAGDKRSKARPDVPTVVEAGYATAQFDLWWGVFAPAGTPPAALEKINSAIKTIEQSQEANSFMERYGVFPATMASAEFGPYVSEEIARWRDLATRKNILE